MNITLENALTIVIRLFGRTFFFCVGHERKTKTGDEILREVMDQAS